MELRRSYQDILDRGVRVVAVSVDDVAQSEALRRRVGLDIEFLSDHDGTLLDHLGVRDDAGLIPGLSAAGFGGDDDVGRAIYLPTTFLLDEDGVIRWIHRADDYRVRATADAVIDAIDDRLPPA